MRLWEQIGAWKAWPGWRRYAPAGGAVLVHGVALAGMAVAMTAAPAPEPVRQVARPIAVELSPEEIVIPVLPEAGVTPPRVKEAPADRKPETGPRVTPGGPVAPAAPDTDTGDSVYLGSPPSVLIDPNAAPGLRGLMGSDPCAVRSGPKPRECAGKELAARTGTMDSVMPRSRQELAKYHGDYMPRCPWLVGCEGGERINPSGTRPPPPQSAASAGAEQLGGIHDSVGRLDFNPDHFDRGFGD